MTDQQALAHFANAVDQLRPVEHWRAWKLSDPVSYPLPINADSLAEAVCQAMTAIAWRSGDRLAVQYTHEGRKVSYLYLYGIKISSKRGRYVNSTNGGRKVWQGSPEPSLLVEIPVAAFAPVEAFDALRDDPVGRDLQLVEQ